MREQTWKTIAAALLLAPALVVVGCKSDGGTDDDTGVVLAEPVAILDHGTGDSDALNIAGVMLIKTAEDAAALGDPSICEDVDFDENDVVIATLGQQPTGGYSIRITALQLEGDTLVVVGTASAPGPDAVVTQALTHPYAAALIANTDATTVIADID